MKESFNDLVDALWKCRAKCPWAKDRTIKETVGEIIKEVDEIKEAVDKNELDEVKEEVGDAIMDCLYLALIAEEKGLFTIKDVFQGVTEKLKRRKPWVFDGMKIKDADEAVKIWNEIKAKEKKNSI